MQDTKTRGRVLMTDELFDSLVYLTFNFPEEHEVDIEPFVKAWQKAGRKLGTVRGQDGAAPSKVVARHLAATTSGFLFKRE